MGNIQAGDIFVLLKCEAQDAAPVDYELMVQDALDSTEGRFTEGWAVEFDGWGHFVRPPWAEDHSYADQKIGPDLSLCWVCGGHVNECDCAGEGSEPDERR